MFSKAFSGNETIRLSFAGLVLLVITGWLGLNEVEQQMKAALQSQLEANLSSNRVVLEKWFKEKQNDAETFAERYRVKRTILALAEKTAGRDLSGDFLLQTEESRWLRELLRPIVERYDYLGFVVFDRSGQQIAALLDSAVGSRNLMAQSDFVQRALAGEVVVSLPFVDKGELPTVQGGTKTNLSTMFVAAPVKDESGKVAAVLSFRIRPEVEFTSIMDYSRTGKTGETYAFNAEGLMISDSRFNSQLKALGLIKDDENAILRVQVRDPGTDSVSSSTSAPKPSVDKRPLTRMAISALKGQSGMDVDGYRNYRGVPVVGAWVWLKKYGIGLATEVDTSEAFASLYTLQQLFLKLLGLLSLFLVIVLGLRVRHARARTSLIASEERSRFVVSSAMDAIITIQNDGIIESFNPAAERIFGYVESEVIGKNVSLLMPEPYHSGHDGYLERYLRTTEPRIIGIPREVIGLRKNKEVFPMDLSVSEMKLTGRRLFIGIARDITQRKEAEQALRKKTIGVELLQGVAVAANEAKTVEEAFQASLGHVCKIIGWPVGHVYLLDTVETSKAHHDELVPTTLWHLDDPVKHKGFREITEDTKFVMGVGLPGRVWASGLPEWIVDVTRDQNCRVYGRKDLGIRAGFAFPVCKGKSVVAVLEFFSMNREERDGQLLEVMAHMGTQLGRVIERKQALDDLKHHADDLKRVNEELRDFTFIASHDLQEPLRKIVTFGDRLASTNLQHLDEPGQLYLGRMQKAAQYALGFIYDLLAYSKVTSETEEPQPIHLEKVVNDMLAEAREEIERSGACIEIKFLPVIEATPLQARQLFQNLISNALKYRKKEVAPVIIIDAKKIDLSNPSPETGEELAQMQMDDLASNMNDGASGASKFWRITVEDNGIGFDEKYSKRIFKPFKRLHTREQFSGSGMGLAICQKIVSRLEGSIAAKGVPNIGAKFLVYLPDKLSERK